MKITNKIKVNSETMEQIMDFIVDQNKMLQSQGLKAKSVNILGERGIGKSSFFKDYAQKKNMHFVKIDPSNMEEQGDLIGFPYIEFYMCKEDTFREIDGIKVPVKGDCCWVTKDFVEQFENIGYKHNGRSRMNYAMPEFIEKIQGRENGIFLIDDMTRANRQFKQSLMSIFLDQETQTWKLPKGWTVVATSNPNTKDYDVEELDLAQSDRFFEFEMEFNEKSWAKWADGKIDERNILFVLRHPELLKGKLSPRSATDFFETIKGKNYEENKVMINLCGESRCGIEFMATYNKEMHNMQFELPSPELILKGDVHAFSSLETCIGKGEKYRADIAWLMMTRIQNYCKNLKADQTQVNVMKKLLVNKIFNDNQSYHLAREVILANKSFQSLVTDPQLLELISK